MLQVNNEATNVPACPLCAASFNRFEANRSCQLPSGVAELVSQLLLGLVI